MLDRLTCEDFAAHLNESFTVTVDASTSVSMELVEAAESAVNPGVAGNRRQFSVVFRHVGEGVLPQQIYTVSHPEMGEYELFIVPIARDGDGVLYEAVFG